MDDAEDPLDDEEISDEDEDLPVEEGEEASEETPTAPAVAGEGEVESIEEILVKKEARVVEEDEDDDALVSLTREERLEPLAVKVVPPQPTEFVCKRCFLVKHRSQLKDKSRQLCRDCA
ncbi:MAG TPA: DUF4193 family protein [Actinomycetota bacterium]|nr:DUF4193 family protein [Actinomycetota bacterium]